jgi:hypothetical protein
MTNEQMVEYIGKAVSRAAAEPLERRFRIFADSLPDAVLSAIVSGAQRLSGEELRKNEFFSLVVYAARKVIRLMEVNLRPFAIPLHQLGIALSFEQARRQRPELQVYVPINPFDERELERACETAIKSVPDVGQRQILKRQMRRAFPRDRSESLLSRILGKLRSR